MDEIGGFLRLVSIWALPVVFAITLHEAAHGFAAKHFGDSTAWMLGRVSLNPLRHIDPVGTVAVPLVALLLGGILFGWAKPVPVNFANLRHPKRDMFWVALAGPASNLLQAMLWAVAIRIGAALPSEFVGEPLMLMGAAGIMINVVLMVLNLFPLPPLDGGRIAVSLLPHGPGYMLARLEPYGLMILLLMLFSGLLGSILQPFVSGMLALVSGLVGLSARDVLQLLRLI